MMNETQMRRFSGDDEAAGFSRELSKLASALPQYNLTIDEFGLHTLVKKHEAC
jgi:hypothetical protein